MELSELTFVIPVHKDQQIIQTLNSIPPECKVIVRRDRTRGMARNEGVRLSDTEYIVLADSDIKFSRQFLDFAISLVGDKKIVGLEAFWPSPLLLSRFCIMKRSDWHALGGMEDYLQHGEESDICISAIEKGYLLVKLPRTSIYHYPHPKSKFKNEYINLFRLIRLHPKFPFMVLRNFLWKMKVSDFD
ncbi:MAG: hypothetical protein WC623_21860 [Pedobacter sp.]|uniref:glycosyltransferase family 2 protein n=1 Tax=Pedobacter sp. TaxID=1411316 RepID=UPI0035615960